MFYFNWVTWVSALLTTAVLRFDARPPQQRQPARLALILVFVLTLLLSSISAQASPFSNSDPNTDSPSALFSTGVSSSASFGGGERNAIVLGVNGADQLILQIPSDRYVYQESIVLYDEAQTVKPLQILATESVEKEDPTFNQVLRHLQGSIEIQWDRNANTPLTLTLQSCSLDSICFAPQGWSISPLGSNPTLSTEPLDGAAGLLPLSAVEIPEYQLPMGLGLSALFSSNTDLTNATAQEPIEPAEFTSGTTTLPNPTDANAFATISLLGMIGIGLLLAFSPCTLPAIPFLVHAITHNPSNQAPMTSVARSGRALGYAMGWSCAYAVIGALLAAFGLSEVLWLRQPWVFMLIAGVMVYLGVCQLRPQWNVLHHLPSFSISTDKAKSPFLIGLSSSLVLSPCVSAPVLAVFAWAMTQDSWLVASAHLFVMGLFMCLPMVLFAVGGTRLRITPGAFLSFVPAAQALLLFFSAYWLLLGFLPTQLSQILFSALFLSATLLLAFWARALRRRLLQLLFSLTAVFFLTLSSTPWLPSAFIHFAPFSWVEPLVARETTVGSGWAPFERDQANTAFQFVRVEADWCFTCQQQKKNLWPLVDLTQQDNAIYRTWDITKMSATTRELLSTWNIAGPPALLAFRPEEFTPCALISGPFKTPEDAQNAFTQLQVQCEGLP